MLVDESCADYKLESLFQSIRRNVRIRSDLYIFMKVPNKINPALITTRRIVRPKTNSFNFHVDALTPGRNIASQCYRNYRINLGIPRIYEL